MGITAGQEFNIVVRRLAPRQTDTFRAAEAAIIRKPGLPARYVTGAFQVKIPVTGDEALRSREENTLAILKWRLLQMPPVYRWQPVVKRVLRGRSTSCESTWRGVSNCWDVPRLAL